MGNVIFGSRMCQLPVLLGFLLLVLMLSRLGVAPWRGARLSCGLGGACTKRWWSWEVLGGLGLARRLEVPDKAHFIPKPQPRSKATSLAGQNGVRQHGLGQTSGTRSPCRVLSSSCPRGAHKFLSPAVSVGPLCTQWGFSHQHSRVPGPSPEFG